jgi:hypothetical protein
VYLQIPFVDQKCFHETLSASNGSKHRNGTEEFYFF